MFNDTKFQNDAYMPKMGRTENLSTDPCSKFRGASFLKNLSNFQNDVYMPKMGRTENLSTDPCSKFRGASFWKIYQTFKIMFTCQKWVV